MECLSYHCMQKGFVMKKKKTKFVGKVKVAVIYNYYT